MYMYLCTVHKFGLRPDYCEREYIVSAVQSDVTGIRDDSVQRSLKKIVLKRPEWKTELNIFPAISEVYSPRTAKAVIEQEYYFSEIG